MSNIIKRPFKLFMLCMVLYVASESFIVGAFVAIAGLHYLFGQLVGSKKESVTASQAAVSASSAKPKPEPPVQAGVDPAYERSAVVTPIHRSGTHYRS